MHRKLGKAAGVGIADKNDFARSASGDIGDKRLQLSGVIHNACVADRQLAAEVVVSPDADGVVGCSGVED